MSNSNMEELGEAKTNAEMMQESFQGGKEEEGNSFAMKDHKKGKAAGGAAPAGAATPPGAPAAAAPAALAPAALAPAGAAPAGAPAGADDDEVQQEEQQQHQQEQMMMKCSRRSSSSTSRSKKLVLTDISIFCIESCIESNKQRMMLVLLLGIEYK